MKDKLTVHKLDAKSWGRLIGQDVKELTSGKVYYLSGVGTDEILTIAEINGHSVENHVDVHMDDCKPILRRLEDMTEEDDAKFKRKFGTNLKYMCGFIAIHYDWFDENGYDILERRWIDAGLAIDAKEVTDER